MTTFKDTIFSLSSGAGLAGVAVIRVSGADAEKSIAAICKKGVESGGLRLRKIFHPKTGEFLDKGLVSWQPGPKTFTGENTVEFQIHGGVASIRSVLDALAVVDNFRQAEAGEFSKRAFMNGRLDLVEIEGLSDLIHAQTQAQRRQALNQTAGTASKKFNLWREKLIRSLAYIEASIDFVEEEDIGDDILDNLRNDLIHLRNEMKQELSLGAKGKRIRDGVRIVLVGEPNVGKSSILNYLARQDVAIVSNIPGTTRDSLEISLDISGIPVVVTDTAGLRENSEDEIERTGMKRSRQKSREADLVVWVGESGKEKSSGLLETESEMVTIWNKSDLKRCLYDNELPVSAKTGEGMDRFYEYLENFVTKNFALREPALLVRDRQISALSGCVEAIEAALADQTSDLELLAENLRRSADQLSRLVGRIDVEDLLDVIFHDFCVGK